MDESGLQLQTRCATAEEKAADLQDELRAIQELDAEGIIASLRNKLENSRVKLEKYQEKLSRQSDLIEAIEMENNTLRSNIANMESQAREVIADLNKIKQMDVAAMVALKKQAESFKNELERFKCKRVDSPSPVRIVTGILQRPVDPPLSEQLHTGKDVPPPSTQPTPKKARSRKDKWGAIDSSRAPPTSSDKDGVKEKHTSLGKKRDPVLNNPPSNSRRKQDIISEIEESAKTLSLSRVDTSFVFHRSNVDE